MNQESLMEFERTYQQSREFEESLGIIEQQIIELESFKKQLDDLEKSEGDEILATLGKGVFLKSKVLDKKLFVDVGSGTIVRKTPKEAVDTIEDQVKKLTEMKNELSMKLNVMNSDLQGLMQKVEAEQEKAVGK
jgi:prefoldin alpha subunit